MNADEKQRYLDAIRSAELQAEAVGVKTYHVIQGDINSDAYREAEEAYQFARNMLQLPDDAPELQKILETSGLSAEEYKSAMQYKADEAAERMKGLSASLLIPTNEFRDYLILSRKYEKERADRLEILSKSLKKRCKTLLIAMVLLAICTCAVSYYAYSLRAAKPTPGVSTASQQESVPSDTKLKQYEQPKNGATLVSFCALSDRVAPLEIKTSGSQAHYVKLVSLSNEEDFMAFFVRPGQTAEIHMPLGNFELRYATGPTWYGRYDLFGPETVYAKSNDILSFTQDDKGYNGYTITLYPVTNGNMDTEQIQASEF